MNTYLKYKPVWYKIMVMGSLIAGATLILTFSSILIVKKLGGLTTEEVLTADLSSPALINVQKVLLMVQTILLFVIPSLLYAYFADPKPMKFLRLNVKPSGWQWLVAGTIVLIALPSAMWLGELNKTLDLSHVLPALDKYIRETEAASNKVIESIISKQSTRDLFVNLLIMAFLPAFGEELLFRGLIQKGLIRSFRNVWVGILLGAFIFSFIHFQFLTFLTRFELGIILGALYWYTGSLWASILAHFVFNGVQVYISYLHPNLKDETLPVSAGIVGGSFLLITLLVIILRKTSTVNMYEVFDDEDEFDFNVGHKDEYLD